MKFSYKVSVYEVNSNNYNLFIVLLAVFKFVGHNLPQWKLGLYT